MMKKNILISYMFLLLAAGTIIPGGPAADDTQEVWYDMPEPEAVHEECYICADGTQEVWYDVPEPEAVHEECYICAEETVLVEVPCAGACTQKICISCIRKTDKCPFCRSTYSRQKLAKLFGLQEVAALDHEKRMRARMQMRARVQEDAHVARELQQARLLDGLGQGVFGGVELAPDGLPRGQFFMVFGHAHRGRIAFGQEPEIAPRQEPEVVAQEEADLAAAIAASLQDQERVDAERRARQFEADEAMARLLLSQEQLAVLLQQEEDERLARQLQGNAE